MNARCYEGARKRTKMKKLKFSWRDLAGTVFTVLFIGGVITLRYLPAELLESVKWMTFDAPRENRRSVYRNEILRLAVPKKRGFRSGACGKSAWRGFGTRGQTYRERQDDEGVHARRQVAHFDTDVEIKPFNLILGANVRLPDDIAVVDAEYTDNSFDARRDAKRKTYVYRMYVDSVRRPFSTSIICRFTDSPTCPR